MAIYLVTGKPGSGKTYYAVYHLLKKYFSQDEVLRDFMPKGEVFIVTNIENIKLNTYSLPEMVKVAGGAGVFFSVEYQKKLLMKWSRIVYIIDEAGEFFGRGLKDEKILFLFQYHRHLGLDFYLLTPSEENLSRGVVVLSEYMIHARSRSGRLLRGFVYDKMYEGEKAGSVSLPIKSEVFRLYRSMEKAEGERIGSFARKYAVFAVGAALLGVLVFMGALKFMISGGFRGKVGASTAGKVVSVVKGSMSKVGVSSSSSSSSVTEVVSKRGLVDPEIIPIGQGVSASGVEGVGAGVNSGQWVDLFSGDFVRVRVVDSLDGEKVIYSEDGRFFDSSLSGELIRSGVVLNGELFIRRRLLVSSPGRFDSDLRRGKAEAGRGGGPMKGRSQKTPLKAALVVDPSTLQEGVSR